MTEKTETLTESLQRMDVLTIRRLVSEAEAYLAEQSYTNILAVIKVGIGLGLAYDIIPGANTNSLMLVSTETAEWKSLGKHLSAAGTLMNKAGINMEVSAENTSDFKGGMYTLTINSFPPPFKFLNDAEDPLTAEEVLEYLEPLESKS